MLKIVVFAVFTALANAVVMHPYGNDQVTPKPLSGGEMDPCSRELVACLAPVMEMGENVTTGGPVGWTSTQLKERCQLFKTAEQCIKNTSEQCRPFVEQQANVLTKVMDFICKDAFNEMIEIAACTSSSKSQRGLKQCIQNLIHGQASRLPTENSQIDTEAQCRLLATYEECVIEVEGEDCGEKAQEVYIKIFAYMNRLIDEQFNCSAVEVSVETDEEGDPVEGAVLEPSPEEKCAPIFAECLKQLETHRAEMVDFDLDALPTICNDYRSAKTCMDSRALECEDSTEWQTLESSFNSMCNEQTLQALGTKDVCFKKTSLTTKLEKCENEELLTEAETKESQTCKVLEEYLSCYLSAVQDECPAQITEAVESVLDGVGGIIELEKSIDCDDEEKAMIDDEPMDEGDDVEGVHVDEAECAVLITSCLRPLEPHRKKFTSFQLETIPEVCSAYGLVQNCMISSAEKCMETPDWNFIEDSFTQICEPVGEGLSECPMRKDVVTQLRSCEKDELKADIQMEDSDKCQVIEDYVNCYTITVDRECEEKDGQVVSKVMTGVAQVIQLDKEVMCVMEDDDDDESEDPDSSEDGDEDNTDSAETKEKSMVGDDLDDRMMQMWGPLSQCLDWLSDIHFTALPVQTFDSVDELCEHFDEAKRCGKPLLMSVSTEVKNKWDSLMIASKYVCHEKRMEFREVYGCFSRSLSAENIIKTCYQRVDENEEVCKMVEEFEQCTTKSVRDECGKDAGDLMEGLMKKMNTLLAREYHVDCPFAGFLTSHKKMVIGLSVGAGLLILLLSCVCVRSCMRRNRRSQNLDKKELVKSDVLANVHLGMPTDSKKGDVATLSVTQLEV